MNLSQLRAFDMVYRSGSLTAAAARLFVTQPAVTNHIRSLETRYAISLFRRRGRGVEPTELGEQLAGISRRLFALEEEASDLLRANEALRSGTLRIAADGPYILIPAVAAFKRRYAGVRVALFVGSTAEVHAALLDEKCDLTVQGRKDEDNRLYSVPLTTHEIIVFVNARHPWARQLREAIDIRELDGEPLIVREKGSTARPRFEQACAGAGIRPDVTIETTSRETVKEAVAAGLGIGVISEAELRSDPRFWPLRVTGADLRYTEYVQCLAQRRKLSVVRAFLDIVDDMVRHGMRGK